MRITLSVVIAALLAACGGSSNRRPDPPPAPPRPIASPEEQQRRAVALANDIKGGLTQAGLHSVAIVANIVGKGSKEMTDWTERIRLELASDPNLTVVSSSRVVAAVTALGREMPVNTADAAFLAQIAETVKVDALVVLRPDPPDSRMHLAASLFNAQGATLGSYAANFEFDLFAEAAEGAKRGAQEELDRNTAAATAGASSCCAGCLVDMCCAFACPFTGSGSKR